MRLDDAHYLIYSARSHIAYYGILDRRRRVAYFKRLSYIAGLYEPVKDAGKICVSAADTVYYLYILIRIFLLKMPVKVYLVVLVGPPEHNWSEIDLKNNHHKGHQPW